MNRWKYSCGIALLLSISPATGQVARSRSVTALSVSPSGPFQLQIHTDATIAPQVQVISSPERLVIDIPDAVPGAGLHAVALRRPEVQRVRVSLFTRNPPVTRIVLDLKEPYWYRIAPNGSGFMVTLGSDADTASAAQPTIGWVSARLSSRSVQSLPASFAVKRSSAKIIPANLPKVNVRFANGLLTIHANDATLSEVLFEIQKQTGAEIAIPSGTEQERVAADFGPGPANQVLQQLLNGSGLNFVVVGSEANPNALRSVILTRNSGPADSPAAFAQAYTPVPPVENIETGAPDVAPQPEDDNSSAPQPPPPGQPAVQAQPPSTPVPNY